MFARPFNDHINPPSVWSELDGIRQHIRKHLLQSTSVSANGVAGSHAGGKRELQILVPRYWSDALYRGVHHGGQIHRLRLKMKAPCNSSRNIQQVINDAHQRRRIPLDRGRTFLCTMGRQWHRAKHACPSQHGVRGWSQFV
jgi:hypothetical protein